MAASEDPSHFTVHVFLRHDPLIARSLLPDLFLDFPDSVWKLTPLLDLPPRPREKPKPGYWRWEKPRDVLGRHVFDESLAGNTTLLQLTEKVEQEFAIPKKYQGQFTIVPQDYDEEGQYPRWHNRPLPWNTTLAEVYQVDLDAPKPSSDGFMTETTMMYAPVLHLVLETKAEALRRIVGAGFLEEEIGEPYRLFRDMWNRFDSFWHSQSGAGQEYSELESKLSVWREAHFASAYLAKQREKGRLGPDNDELRAGFRRVDELREQAKQDDLSSETGWALNAEMRSRTPRIRQIEKNEANRQEQLREISRFVTQWEDWILNRDFQNFAIRLLETDKVESKVASVFRKARQVIDEWKLSEGSQRLRVSIEEEYYDARPWLTQESRAQSERSRLEELECATRLPTTLVSGDAATSMNNPLIPSPQIHAHSMRRSDGKLHLDQSTFTVSSGSLLWGQIICLYSAMSHPNFTQNADHIAPELEGGTILQHRFSYRSAARNGPWKVRQYSERARVGRYVANPDGPDRHVGWILYHQDVNPRNTLERVRALDGTGPGAVSNRNLHTDKDILYIGRYDWSYHFHEDLEPKFEQWAEPVIGAIPDTQDPGEFIKCNVRNGGYLIAIDEANFDLDFVAAYKRGCDSALDTNRTETTIEKVFRKDGANFGTFLSMASAGEDYGWLVFSGEQHADHAVDELVAVVYSNGRMEAMYHSLEGDPSRL